MTIHLLRHAHTDWNGPPKRFQGRSDVPLSEKGKESCIAARNTLEITPDLIISSPALRCQETARLLFPEKSIELEPRLWEIDTGYFSGLTHEEAANQHPKSWEIWQNTPAEIRPGDGELLSEMLDRFLQALGDWEKCSQDYSILFVTHGGPIRALRLHFKGLSLNQFHGVGCDNLELMSL